MSSTVGEILARTLVDLGATQVFGVVGDALNGFTEPVRREPRLQWIGVRHEEGAALAAVGQAKLTGRLGVCAGTTGPGANHLLSGVYEAAHDHAPVLAISGDIPTDKGGVDYLQWADHVQAFRDASVYAATIASPDAAAAQIHEAIATAYMRNGVALLNIPQDIFTGRSSKTAVSLATLRPPPECSPAPNDLDAAARLLDAAKSVTLFVGAGARGAAAEVLALSDRLKAPVVHTFRGLELFPFDDPRVVGGLGLIGSSAGYDAMHSCEALLMVGSDYPYGDFLPQTAKVVQIDQRGFAIGRRLPVAQGVVGSCRPALAGLLERVAEKSDDAFLARHQRTWAGWRKMLDEKADLGRSPDRIHPQALARTISDLARPDAAFCIDTGEVTLWSGNWLRPTGRQNITASFNNASVGVALGMANGVQALNRSRQVIAICGDGGFTMLMQEFFTAVQHNLPIKCIVFNNGGWGLVHLEMEEAGLPAFAGGVKFKNPDFAMFAQACGGTGFRITKPHEMREGIARALGTPGPVVVDVAVAADELPSLPHFNPAAVWRFGVGKAREWIDR